MSYDEIAEVLSISLGTVKSRITRGRDALRKKLTEYVREVGPELGVDHLPPLQMTLRTTVISIRTSGKGAQPVRVVAERLR